MSQEPVQPPSKFLMLAEGRAAWELGATVLAWPLLALAPRGDGHTVLVLPGLAAGDLSTRLLRRYLRGRGYDVHGWALGRNFGPRPGIEEGMEQRLKEMYERQGRKVSLVGWSLGGAFAHILATRYPQYVRSVVTLGSPFVGSPRSTNAWRFYEWVSGQRAEDPTRLKDVHAKPTMPTTSIFSRTDGVVAWRCSVNESGPGVENIEVRGSHIGLGANGAVFYALADRLSQPEGQWKPFNRGVAGPLVYPDPERA